MANRRAHHAQRVASVSLHKLQPQSASPAKGMKAPEGSRASLGKTRDKRFSENNVASHQIKTSRAFIDKQKAVSSNAIMLFYGEHMHKRAASQGLPRGHLDEELNFEHRRAERLRQRSRGVVHHSNIEYRRQSVLYSCIPRRLMYRLSSQVHCERHGNSPAVIWPLL